jgi:molybdenum cofactor cytidylyltransferase
MSAPDDRVCGVLLAGGAGRRFGPDGKQLAPLGGRPLLQWAVDAACASGLDEVVVVLGARAALVRDAVAFGRARVVVADDWDEGMAASLRRGVQEAAAGGSVACEWAAILLGDAPRIAPAAIDTVAAAARGAGPEVDAVRLRVAGRPTHPVALRRRLFGAVAALRGDVGARAILAGATILEVDGDAFGNAGDVDDAEALRELE